MKMLAVAAGLAALSASPALAIAQYSQSGSANGMSWEARSLIVGMAPTGNVASPGVGGGGDARYYPSANKSGVVSLIMDYGAQGRFICTGSLLSDRVTVLTAAHCIAPRNGVSPVTTAYRVTNPDSRTPFNATGVVANKQGIHAGYTGQVIDHNDIAYVRLSKGLYGIDAYGLFEGNDLSGLTYNVAGYGGRSTVGGAGANGGVNAGTGFLREGDNRFEYRMGDPTFRNGWAGIFPSNPNIAFSWIADFDSGLATNDQACRVAQASNLAAAAGAIFCNTGVGAREVSTAGGDSGGPLFVNGKIAAVTSYGLSFGTAWGDCRAGLQSSCGELNGSVPVYIHRDFIAAAMAVPEPQSWAMLIAGFGLVGAVARRRRALAA